MTTVALWVLGATAGLAVYTYIGYPLLLIVIARLRPRHPQPAPAPAVWPMVSITIPVYNEERTIRDKLEHVLRYDYPPDRLQILVVSDCSTDRTEEIVGEFTARGVQLLRLPQRRGKTAAENAALPLLRGEIICNSDASIRVPPGALKQLVLAFQDPTVGVASGRDVSVTAHNQESNQGESDYVGYEMWVRRVETRAYGIVGASGCFYAVRAPLQRILVPEALSRDFSAPLVARSEGYRAVSVDAAIAFVPRVGSLHAEYRRKVRTISRGMQTLYYRRALLNPFRYGTFAWMLWSHKICRWLLPWAGVVALVALGVVALELHPARWALGVVAIAGLMALTGWLWPETRPMPSLVGRAAALATGNLSVLHATLHALHGNLTPTWEPTRREARGT